MKYANINRRFTATVAEYLANGYTINTDSMSGSQGDHAHIDLTNGTEVIRILIDSFREDNDIYLAGLEIIVGLADREVEPNCDNGHSILWNTKLDIIDRERFYEIGRSLHHGKFYGTLEEATAAERLRVQRCAVKHQRGQRVDITARAIEIAKRIIRRELSIKRNASYYVNYKGKTCKVFRLY